MEKTDREAIVGATTDYVESYFDGDAARMASCLHPRLAKRRADDHEARTSGLVEAPFEEMTTEAVAGGPKDLGREVEITILDVVDGIATAKVVSEPFVDMLHLARFGDRWLIVNALWQRRPGADGPGDAELVSRALDDYSRSWFDRDVDAVRGAVHPALVERRVLDAASGSLDLDENGFEELIEIIADGPDEPVERAWDAEVLDVSGDIASGKVIAAWFDIYLHLARFADRWMIVNILYRSTWEPA
ncbi:MAG: nuclear transport factor 2 family protein [Actinomycetota bacterium]